MLRDGTITLALVALVTADSRVRAGSMASGLAKACRSSVFHGLPMSSHMLHVTNMLQMRQMCPEFSEKIMEHQCNFSSTLGRHACRMVHYPDPSDPVSKSR